MRQPESVSEVIAGGSGGFIGILRDNPACVLKSQNADAVECLQRETETFRALGPHKHIAGLEAVRQDDLLPLRIDTGLLSKKPA